MAKMEGSENARLHIRVLDKPVSAADPDRSRCARYLITMAHEEPDAEDVQRAKSIKPVVCDCCGDVTLWLFDASGKPFARATMEPEQFADLAKDVFDQLGVDDEELPGDGFPAVEGSA